MQKSQSKKRWIWMAAFAGLTLVVVVMQSLSGTSRSGKTKKM
jgi:hypothetical protein